MEGEDGTHVRVSFTQDPMTFTPAAGFRVTDADRTQLATAIARIDVGLYSATFAIAIAYPGTWTIDNPTQVKNAAGQSMNPPTSGDLPEPP